MSQENERRARELLLAASKDWEERSFEAGVGTVIKALDEAEARGIERASSYVLERSKWFMGGAGQHDKAVGLILEFEADRIRALPPTPTTEKD